MYGFLHAYKISCTGGGLIQKFFLHCIFYRNLQDLLEDFLLDFKTKGPPKASSDGGTVFPTSADLFVFYKKCLVQCASLSTGAALLDLCTVFRKYLKEYCNKLLANNMPKLQQSKWVIATNALYECV